LDGSVAGDAYGLLITVGGSRVSGLVIDRFTYDGHNPGGIGIVLQNGGGNVIEGNFIGTDASGLADLGTRLDGVQINDSADNTIGGTTPGERNVIAGNDRDGIDLGDSSTPPQHTLHNVISGNFIGVDATGNAALGNGYQGIEISADQTTIGGDSAG